MQSPTYKLDLPKTDSHPADNLTLIAAIDLLKLTAPVKSGLMPAKSKTYGYNASMSRILQAACFLEHAHSKSGANPQIKLVLILIYRLLGTGSLAMEMYKKLNLKGVQNDTLSYALFDRISKFHPHETKIKIGGKVEVLSPLKDIRAADYFFQTADPQTINNIIRSFSEGSYDTILGLVAVRQALENSMASVLIPTEQRELMRLAGQKDELVMSDRLSQSSTYSGNPITREWVSNFDYKSAFPNFEIDQSATLPQKHDFLRCGPPPNKFRTLLSLATDKLFWFFSWAPTTISFNIEGILRSEITQHASHFYQYYSDILSPKTSDELDELLTHGEHVLVAAVLFAHAVLCPHTVDAQQQSAADSHWARFGVGSQLYQNLEMAFAELTANLTGEKCETQNVPKFEVLEPLYAAHQAAGLVIQLSQFVNGPQKPKAIGSTTATTVHSFAKAAVDIQRLVEKVSRDLKKRVNSPELEGNALGWLKGGFEGTEAASKVDAALLEVVGQKEMAQFAKEVTGSWRDAVLGLDLLKVDENIGKL
jgi:N-terminal acetyltransferase B complex non-catalytic subunit